MTDTMLCLNANSGKAYHLEIGKIVSLNSIARTNESRSSQIYEDLAMSLIQEVKKLYINDDDLDLWLKGNVFAIDATRIDFCLSTFYWATFRSTKAGIKLHTQLDLKTSIPEFILFSNAPLHDVNALDSIRFEANSFYVMVRGYCDYKRLYKIHSSHAFYVTRAKDNMEFRRVYSKPKDTSCGIVYDQIILLTNFSAAKDYLVKIRRIKFKDQETGKVFVFLTNNLELKATEMAQLYKHRWNIELFLSGSNNI